MPTITALKIVNDAKTILQETTGVRWPDAELLGWLSAGEREIVMLVPSAYTTMQTVPTQPTTTLQALPSDGYMLVDIVNSSGQGSGVAITPIDLGLMNRLRRTWRTDPESASPLHFIYDPRSPRVYHLYPKPAAGVTVDMVYSKTPPDLSSLAQTINLDDIYSNALTDYVLYRAYSKDLETVGSAERAVAHRQAFENTLGLKAQAMASNQPVPAAR